MRPTLVSVHFRIDGPQAYLHFAFCIIQYLTRYYQSPARLPRQRCVRLVRSSGRRHISNVDEVRVPRCLDDDIRSFIRE